MAISGNVMVKLDLPEIEYATKRAVARASRDVAAMMEDYVKTQCSKPSPPPSNPGNYPHRDSGDFVDGINVTGTGDYVTIATEAEYGVYLNEGTANMEPRPWVHKMLTARNWGAIWTDLIERYMGG